MCGVEEKCRRLILLFVAGLFPEKYLSSASTSSSDNRPILSWNGDQSKKIFHRRNKFLELIVDGLFINSRPAVTVVQRRESRPATLKWKTLSDEAAGSLGESQEYSPPILLSLISSAFQHFRTAPFHSFSHIHSGHICLGTLQGPLIFFVSITIPQRCCCYHLCGWSKKLVFAVVESGTSLKGVFNAIQWCNPWWIWVWIWCILKCNGFEFVEKSGPFIDP